MLTNALDSITKLIDFPLVQLIVGLGVTGLVWKVFERVEGVLTEDTKLEIGLWLLGTTKYSTLDLDMPASVRSAVRKVFGKSLPTEESFNSTWKFIGILTCLLAFGSVLWPSSIARRILIADAKEGGFDASKFFGAFFFTSLFAAIATHLCFISTRWIFERVTGKATLWRLYFLSLATFLLTLFFVALGIPFLLILGSFDPEVRNLLANMADRWPTVSEVFSCASLAVSKTLPFGLVFVPVLVLSYITTMWVQAGMILKGFVYVSRRAAVLEQWFFRHADLEKHPLSSIGLVAGVLGALIYWSVVLIVHLV